LEKSINYLEYYVSIKGRYIKVADLLNKELEINGKIMKNT
jgi:predicted RNA-binding protein